MPDLTIWGPKTPFGTQPHDPAETAMLKEMDLFPTRSEPSGSAHRRDQDRGTAYTKLTRRQKVAALQGRRLRIGESGRSSPTSSRMLFDAGSAP